ncbi:DUF5959 family protein [Streptomyces asoensis]|uniref:DUF5959 family protein n=1 Tax=Streptomyces asoensis TaxID=249586 RepID=UPI00371D08FF
MAEGGAVDLIHLADDESSLLVRVLGRHMPGVLSWHDFLDAEIVVGGGFAQGRLEVCLAPDDLDCWSEVLDVLAAGRDASWMDDGRNPEIRFEPAGQAGVVVVAVEDHAGSGTSVRVAMRVPEGWVSEHRKQLQRVRAVWPQEVVETSPNTYEWRR